MTSGIISYVSFMSTNIISLPTPLPPIKNHIYYMLFHVFTHQQKWCVI